MPKLSDHRKIMDTSEASTRCIIVVRSPSKTGLPSNACCCKNIPPGGGSETAHFKRCHHVYWGKVLAGGQYRTPRSQPVTKSMFCEVSRPLHASFSGGLTHRGVLRLTSLSASIAEKQWSACFADFLFEWVSVIVAALALWRGSV